MFDQVFSWLESPHSILPRMHTMLSSAMGTVEKETAVEHEKMIRRNYMQLRYGQNPDAQALQQSLAQLDRAGRYLRFLDRCIDLLQKEEGQSMYWLLLKMVLANAPMRHHAIRLFEAWLKQDACAALEFYEQFSSSKLQATNEDDSLNTMLIPMATTGVRFFLDDLTQSIQHQKNPLGLCQLSIAFISSPLQFAACILWIIEQGGDVQSLIESKLLHHFISYHLPTFGCDNGSQSAVFLLYQVLHQFPCAIPLLEQATKTSCDIRGFRRMNLFGTLSNRLVSVEAAPHITPLTRTIDNLNQIVSYFNGHGLSQAIAELFQGSNDAFDQYFIHFAHQKRHLITPLFVQQFTESHPEKLSNLAQFVDDAQFQQWMVEEKYCILYLIPHKPSWLHSFNPTLLESLLTSMTSSCHVGSELECAKLLLSLYNATLSTDSAIAKPVFESLLTMVLNYRYLIDEQSIYLALTQSTYLSRQVDIRVECLSNALLEKTRLFINGSQDATSYDALFMFWKNLLNTFEILSLLKPISVPFPITRTNFIVYLFEQAATQEARPWNSLLQLTELIIASEPKINQNQRETLLTILARVDDVHLRKIMVAHLNAFNPSFLENDQKTLLNGVAYQNIGLLDLYLSSHDLDDAILQQAIRSQRWPMISYWLEHYGFKNNSQNAIDFLLVEVSRTNNIPLLRALIKASDLHFSANGVAHAFANAANADNHFALNYLYTLKPRPMTLKAVITQSIKDNRYQALAFFKRFKKYNEHLANGILQGFNYAVFNSDTTMVKKLMEFTRNGPNPSAIKTLKNRLEERHWQATKKNKEQEVTAHSSTKEMLQLLGQLQKPMPASPQQKKSLCPKAKLPPLQSFYSTESLDRAGSSLFNSQTLTQV